MGLMERKIKLVPEPDPAGPRPEWVVVVEPDAMNVDKIYFVDWRIIGVVYMNDDVPMMWREGSVTPADNPTTKYDEAHYEAKGRVKWDGCSDWDTHPELSVHTCSHDQFKEIMQESGTWE